MKKFVVSAPSWFPSSGGITILHKLVHVLNELGYDAYLAPSGPSGLGWHMTHIPFESPAKYTGVKLITQDVYDNLQDAIVVYPETWYGNYLNAPNVVRWIMGPVNEKFMTAGHGWGVRWDAWKESELWFWYTDLYKTKNFSSHKQKNLDNDLYLPEFHRDIFYNRNEDRIINCWTMRKSTGLIDPKDYIHDPADVFFADINNGDDFNFAGKYQELANLLNKTNKFYSYDAYTFVSIQALMCGADSIVYPMSGLSRESYIKGNDLHRYIAYGTDDLERARSIRGELDDHMNLIEKNTIEQIHTFVQKCQDYFK
jgi:hypothetical protein